MDKYNNNQSRNGDTDNSYPNNTNPWETDPFGQPQPPGKPVVIDTMANKKGQLASTSLVLGILAIVFCWAFLIPFILGLTGLIMGITSLYKTKQNSGIAVAGAIVSGVGMGLNILITLFYIFIFLL